MHALKPASPFSEFFLTRAEKDNIANWQYKVYCPGVLSAALNPVYNYIVRYIPPSISPNVLSIVGLMFSIFAWQNSTSPSTSMMDPFPALQLAIVGLSILMYMTLDDIDGKHSRQTLNSSPLGELVDHFCDCITNGLLTHTICNLFGIYEPVHVWLMIVFTGSKFALEHLHAFADPEKMLRFDKYTGPTEILVFTIICVFLRNFIVQLVGPQLPMYLFRASMVVFAVTIVQIIYSAYKAYKTERDYCTLVGIWVCLVSQLVKFVVSPNYDRFVENGIIFSTLTADLIIAKMANRQVHQLIPVMHMASIILPISSIPFALFYFFANVMDISSHMKISVINPVTNVFVSGYYDGLHEGHVASLLKASRFGSKLTVGVHSDEDYMKFKFDEKRQNKLMNNHLIRSTAVAKIPFVDHVIPNCPLTVTPEFLRAHKIHLVGISDEYVYEQDPVTKKITKCQKDYAPVMDNLVIIPRTQGISSSELRQHNVDTYEEFRKIEDLVKDLTRKIVPEKEEAKKEITTTEAKGELKKSTKKSS